MKGHIFIKPVDTAVKIRDPKTGKPLAAAGEWKVDGSYWQRRLRDKDVVEATPPTATGGAVATDLPGDPVAELLAGTVAAVKAGVSELADAALADALGREKAATTPRTQVINAIQAEIDRRAGGKQ